MCVRMRERVRVRVRVRTRFYLSRKFISHITADFRRDETFLFPFSCFHFQNSLFPFSHFSTGGVETPETRNSGNSCGNSETLEIRVETPKTRVNTL